MRKNKALPPPDGAELRRLAGQGMCSVEFVMDYLSVSRVKAYGLLDSAGGPLRSCMIDGNRRVFRVSLDDYLAACLAGTVKPTPRSMRKAEEYARAKEQAGQEALAG